MELPGLQRHIQASQIPLQDLAANSHLSQKEKVGEVTRQFEAVLLRQILSEAQKPVFQSKALGGSSFSNDVYRDLVTSQMADQISRSGTLGLAHDLQNQLQHQLKLHTPPPATAPGSTASAAPTQPQPQPETQTLKRPKYD